MTPEYALAVYEPKPLVLIDERVMGDHVAESPERDLSGYVVVAYNAQLFVNEIAEPLPKPAEAPPKPKKRDEELDKKVRRIIREIPDPTPQPGGE